MRKITFEIHKFLREVDKKTRPSMLRNFINIDSRRYIKKYLTQ